MHRLIQRTLPVRQYVGPVATRCWVPNAAFNNPSFPFGFSSRLYHFKRGDAPWIKVCPGGGWWSIGASGQGEAVPTVAPFATITMSIEYPAGVFHQVKWRGSTTLTFGANPSIAAHMSDAVFAFIPDGAMFWTRMFMSVPAGATVGFINHSTTPGTWMDLARGDAANAGGVDQTMSGTITDDGTVSPGQLPILAIVGPTRRPTVGLFGDSRMQGWFDSVAVSPFGDAGEAARSLGPFYGYINAGIGSDEIGGVVANNGAASALRRQLMALCSHVVLEFGGNDLINAGSPAATVISQLKQVLGMPGLAGKSVIVDTILPVSTSTDNWATTTNQTTNGVNPARNTTNGAIRTGLPGSVGHYDPCAYGEFEFLTGSGLWIPGSITADGTHMNTTGYAGLVASGQINPKYIRMRG
jgi:lysophospholipase L1-like esterase